MRRLIAAVAAAFALLCFLAPPQVRASTPEVDRLVGEAWYLSVKQGDVDGAMQVWKQIVELTRSRPEDRDLCGHYAMSLGRAFDQRERYAEAVHYFDIQAECWAHRPDEIAWDVVRAEQIRPQIRAFVSRPTGPEPVRNLAKHEPLWGTMLGSSMGDPTWGQDLSKVAGLYGKTYGMILLYSHWDRYNPYPGTILELEMAQKAGAALQVGWEPWDGLDAVEDDEYVRAFAKSLKDYGHPVFLRYASEMDMNGVPWHGDPAKYVEKFRLIAKVMRRDAPNVAMVWSPNGVSALGVNVHDYYPGDDYVDWIGISAYHDAYFLGNPDSRLIDSDLFYTNKRVNPSDKVKKLYTAYAARKPMMISETGFGWANRSPYLDESAWAAGTLKEIYGYLPLLYPRIKAVTLFNVDFNKNPKVPSRSHYVLSGNQAVLAAYKQATATDWYRGLGAAQPKSFWREMNQATLRGPTRVAAYVHLGGGVSRVEWLVDGQVKATVRQLPWEADLDLSGLTGAHDITVRAYDLKGRLGHEQTYTFDASAVKVKLNGRYLDFDQPPVIVDGRTLVPARVILEALGAEISWDAATQTVVAKRSGSVLRLQIGNTVPTLDGKPVKALDVPAQLIGGRTLVPARFVAENYQMDVGWEQETQTVVIASRP